MKRIKNLPQVLDCYLITESGEVYSETKQRYLKGSLNSCNYRMVSLKQVNGKSKWFMVHRLVALTYLGKPEANQTDVNHIDENKLNNHYSNLEWCTHSENIKKSYDNGRKATGNHTTPGKETRLLMSKAKYKPVTVNGIKYESIQQACEQLNIDRKTFERISKGQTRKYKHLVIVYNITH